MSFMRVRISERPSGGETRMGPMGKLDMVGGEVKQCRLNRCGSHLNPVES